MKRTWIAVTAVTLFTLTSAAFVKEQLSPESTMGEDIALRLTKFREMLANVSGLPSETRPRHK